MNTCPFKKTLPFDIDTVRENLIFLQNSRLSTFIK